MDIRNIVFFLAVSAPLIVPSQVSALDLGVSIGGENGVNAGVSVGGGNVADASASIGGGSGANADASVGGDNVASASASVGGGHGVDADASVGGGSVTSASVSIGGRSGADADISVGGGSKSEASASVGGSRSDGNSNGGGEDNRNYNTVAGKSGGATNGGAVREVTAVGAGIPMNRATTSGQVSGDSSASLADRYVGRDVMTKDRLVVGRVAEIRSNGSGCPTLGVSPAASLEIDVSRMWVTLASCKRSSSNFKPIRLSVTSGSLMRQYF